MIPWRLQRIDVTDDLDQPFAWNGEPTRQMINIAEECRRVGDGTATERQSHHIVLGTSQKPCQRFSAHGVHPAVRVQDARQEERARTGALSSPDH